MTKIAAPLNTEPLWTRARAMFARAVAAVGDAASIATLTLLPHGMRRRIIGWLRLLEHVVRKLLLAEAAEIRQTAHEGSPALACAPKREGRRGARRTSPALAEKSAARVSGAETWRAPFSLALPRRRTHTPSKRMPQRALRALRDEDEPFRLARRLESLRRVLADPRPHAERLARMLARRVRGFPNVARLYAWAGARTPFRDPRDERLSIDVYAPVFASEPRWGDSS